MPLIRLPEMYYILAECATDPTEAADWLNTVRANRGIPADVDLVGDDAFDQLDSRPGCDNTQTKRIVEIQSCSGYVFFYLFFLAGGEYK